MSATPKKRAFGTLRRALRRRRAPSPSEQEWLRLILLVRKLQRSQVGIAHRLDEVRTLSGAAGAFRLDFAGFRDELSSLRNAAQDLEKEFGAGLSKLQGLPDPAAESAAIDRRAEKLDGLAARLETVVENASSVAHQQETGVLVRMLGDLTTRVQVLQDSARMAEGQNELGKLYERMQELAENLAVQRVPAPAPPPTSVQIVNHGLDGPLARFDAQLEYMASAVQALSGPLGNTALDGWLMRLEGIAQSLEQRPRAQVQDDGTQAGFAQLLQRFEYLAERIEQAPVALPELPPEAVVTAGAPDPGAGSDPGAVGQLQASLVAERETARRSEGEVEELRKKLRASELARVEQEAHHAGELTQMADHVQQQLRRVQDDLKKKKRGMAELTQQNIALQTKVGQMMKAAERREAEFRDALAAASSGPLPAAPGDQDPKAGSGPIAPLMRDPQEKSRPAPDESERATDG